MPKENLLPLFIKLPSGENYGWGICGKYLKKELEKITKVFILENEESGIRLSGKLFSGLMDINFNSLTSAKGIQNYGYTFFESELTDLSAINSRNYDLILCGSTWCTEKLAQRNILNTGILLQGIDPEIFYPVDEKKSDETFVIFSGGKFELRKGQDLVLKAVKILQEKYDDIYLVNSWHNIWPETMKSMYISKLIKIPDSSGSWKNFMNNLYELNGLDSAKITTYKNVPYKKQRYIYAKTDIGIFPNRCEGGTNLVMMEYMACGKPVIASFTSGHKDILNSENSIMLNDLKEFKLYDNDKKLIADWQEPSPEELVDKIEYAYNHREKIRELGKKAGEHLKKFTWEKSAKQVLDSIYQN